MTPLPPAIAPPAGTAPALSTATAPVPSPVDALGADLASAFGGTNLLYYAGALAGSAALAFGGGDQWIRVVIQQHVGSTAYGDVADVTGYVVPIVVAPAVWLTGLALGDRDATGAGSAAVQAVAMTAVSTAILKIGVGRAYPLDGRNPSAPDRLDHPEDARTFRPFQSWAWPLPAWPSGHASTSSSVVAALTGYYGGDALWIPLVGYPVAAAIDFGMLAGDRHWTSDVLAGAVLGQCIGWSVGRAFRARARAEAPPRVSLVPSVGSSAGSVAIVGSW